MQRVAAAAGARVEWLLVAAQVAVITAVLGFPNLSRVSDFFTSGVASSANVVAVITALVWLAAGVLAVTLGVATARRAWRGRRSAWLPVVAVVAGLSCLSAGIVHHEASTFRSCCGSLDAAQSALAGEGH